MSNAFTLSSVLAHHDITGETVVYACLSCGSIGVAADEHTAEQHVENYDMTCCEPATTVLWPATAVPRD